MKIQGFFEQEIFDFNHYKFELFHFIAYMKNIKYFAKNAARQIWFSERYVGDNDEPRFKSAAEKAGRGAERQSLYRSRVRIRGRKRETVQRDQL